MAYKSLNDAKYTEFRRNLIKEKGSDRQREFLRAAKSDDGFLKLVRGSVETTGEIGVPDFKEKLTEHQYKDSPKTTESEIYLTWQDIPPETACRVTFWGEVTLQQIEGKLIHAYYLAANGGASLGGLERIDQALDAGEDKLDSCVREILRRLSGLPEARGNRSVYVNCPFGRAWWRERMANDICSTTGATRDDVLNVLRLSNQYWEEIVTLIVSRNSVLGDRNARDALVWGLTEKYISDPKHKAFNSKNLKIICRLLGTRCVWQELGILDIEELKKMIVQDIDSL